MIFNKDSTSSTDNLDTPANSNTISVLSIDKFTGTITLTKPLSVDVLTMNSGTITNAANMQGTVHFDINQVRAGNNAASSWTGGNIEGGSSNFWFTVTGDSTHTLTLNVTGNATVPTTFSGLHWGINKTSSSTDTVVNWTSGDVNISTPANAPRVYVANDGTFNAISKGRIIGDDANKRWRFSNDGVVVRRPNGFTNCDYINGPGGQEADFKTSLDGTPGTVYVAGSVSEEGGDHQVQGGTYAVILDDAGTGGDFTMSSGTFEIGGFGDSAALSVDTTYTQTGGTVTGDGATITVGASDTSNYTQTGGSDSYAHCTINVTGAMTLADSTSQAVTTLASDTSTINPGGGMFINLLGDFGSILGEGTTVNGAITNAGIIDIGNSGGTGGILTVNADFTQTGTGRLNYNCVSAQSYVVVNAVANVAGTVAFTFAPGANPQSGYRCDLFFADSLSMSCSFSFPSAPPHSQWQANILSPSQTGDDWELEL